MSAAFNPRNDLEHSLLGAQEGRIQEQEFMQTLLTSQVFMPILDKTGITGFQDSTRAKPLVLEDEAGGQVVVLFTSPEQAKPFLASHPGYEGGLLAEFTWVLERIGSGVGIAINPGSEVGLDMEPDMVRHLAEHAGAG